MFMGVVAQPVPEHNFNGKIMLQRISQKKELKRGGFSTVFSDDFFENHRINNSWKNVAGVDETKTPEELQHLISGHFVIDMHVERKANDGTMIDVPLSQRLVFRYQAWNNSGTKLEWKTVPASKMISECQIKITPNGQSRPLTVQDISLKCEAKKHDIVEEDITCDSSFMIKHMATVANMMRDAYHWVPAEETLYLVMDNAGGHGTNDVKAQYTAILAEKNIEIVWQVPRSPETNLLDLGVWCSCQAVVEKRHRRRVKSSVNALARTVEEVWHEIDPIKLQKVYRRFELVLSLIIADHGDNKSIDKHRGELMVPLAHPSLANDGTDMIDMVEDENSVEDIAID